MLVSVIVPIYNVQDYLQECLDSIASQTYQNLEIIMVDDGSTDKSGEIAKSYLKDLRFRLICQENKGLSGARNKGLQNARGDFIYFIDSDDYIAPRYIEELLDLALRYQADMVCNDQIIWFYSPSNWSAKPIKTPQVFIPTTNNICFGGAVWRFLFRHELIERVGVRFLEGKIYEDEAFLYMIAPFAHSFVRFSGEPYFYRQRQESIMARHKRFRSYDLLDVFESIYLFYQQHGLLKKFNPPFYFLYQCGIGYENEEEYLRRAKELAQKLQIPQRFYTPPPTKISRCISLCKKICRVLLGGLKGG